MTRPVISGQNFATKRWKMENQLGNYTQFKAITKIHLGSIGKDILPGNIIEFDGSNTRIGGQVHNITSIAGAIRIGWLVPLSDNTTKYVAQPANIQVHSATPSSQDRGASFGIERAVDDERQVGSLSASNARRKEAQDNQFNSNYVPTSEGPIAMKKYAVIHEEQPVEINYKTGPNKADDSFDPSNTRVDDNHNMDARPVARLRPAKMGAIDVSDSRALQSELRALDPITGSSATIKRATVSSTSRTNADAVGGVPITRNHPNGATGDVAVAVSGYELEDLLGDSVASSGKPKTTVPSFVWDKTPAWRTRVKLAVTAYGNDPAGMQRVFAVEDATVVKYIKDAMAK